jgi:gliding motility-associated-like protein
VYYSQTFFEDLPVAFQNLSQGANQYQWSFGDGRSSTLVHPSNTYPDPGDYTICLIATNEIGCKDTVCKPITIHEEYWIYVPNTFTPDGDEFNTRFKPVMVNIVASEVSIYDRWGLLVFHSNDLMWEWDGTYENLLVPDGTYTYKISYETKQGITDKLVGHVNVLK